MAGRRTGQITKVFHPGPSRGLSTTDGLPLAHCSYRDAAGGAANLSEITGGGEGAPGGTDSHSGG